jgi:transposase
MRVAVSKFVGKYEKEPTRALLDLSFHYGFNHRFCNARRGNEKGHGMSTYFSTGHFIKFKSLRNLISQAFKFVNQSL